ncbi:MAG TPA: malto-oligosyltrehalose trehalohydrolase [Verrucomicrobiae bacterium]
MKRRLPIGAELQEQGGAHFRVWAPRTKRVAVEFYRDGKAARAVPLGPEPDGYFSGNVPDAKAGDLYKLKLDHGSFPDPASRFQPEGPHGPSQIVDPFTFKWTDRKWSGLPVKDIVLYELHLGTFTEEGTWAAAARQLPELKELGITALEIMPIAEFPGRFGWGYDGVSMFAPTRLYGSPDDARAFINTAHELGLMVILDVVYNHFGPDGNYHGEFSADYFTKNYKCEWGEALNFDGPNSTPVREFFVSNARYWIEEFHFDGFRFDATQSIYDASEKHILAEITTAARAAAPNRVLYMVGENEPQETKLVRDCDSRGCGLDALWNDDFHHSAHVAATGHREAYYYDYNGAPQEFVSAAKYGYLYQGQFYAWQKKRRGTPAFDLTAKNFVTFLENHDQVANSLKGERLHQRCGRPILRAMTALTLLMPSTPMLFMGEEFAASAPFLYFADHNPELNKLVRQGRGEFIAQFRSVAAPEARPLLDDPSNFETFRRCKLGFAERKKNHQIYEMYRDLLRIRREDRTISDPEFLDGAVLGENAFALRYFSAGEDDRLLIVNMGATLYLNVCPEPLLAPLQGKGWRALWSSEDPKYGGHGTPALETTVNWIIPGRATILMCPDENAQLAIAKLNQND